MRRSSPAGSAKLVLAGRDTAAIEPVAEEARALGVPVIVVPCDLTQSAQTEALARHALEAFGRIDVLVNNAGYGYLSAIEEGDDADVRR